MIKYQSLTVLTGILITTIFKLPDVFTMYGSNDVNVLNKLKKQTIKGNNCLQDTPDPFGMNRMKDS